MAEPRDLLLGLDAGNTVIKAVLFDARGNQLAIAKRDGRSSTPAPGHVERDLNELWANAATVIRECLDRAGADAQSVARLDALISDASPAPTADVRQLRP